MESLVLVAAVVLAFANGANDNAKGVATLYGTGELSYRAARVLATVTTFLGCMTSIVVAAGLAKAFSAKGLVPPEVLKPAFLGAVGLGAAATVGIATRFGWPISTTHALVGAIVGAGLWGAGDELELGRLGAVFLIPLAVSPLLATAMAAGGTRISRRMGRATSAATGQDMAHSGSEPAARERSSHVRRLHLVSGSLVGFARGLNDTPKILGLVVGASSATPFTGSLAIAVAMALGGWIAARRVTERLAKEISVMAPAEGLAGNLTAAFLVIGASRFGVPVSTTHVTTGGVIGLGLANGRLRLQTAGQVLGSWLLTLPLAALLAATALAILGA